MHLTMKSLLVENNVTVDLGEKYAVVIVEDGEGTLISDCKETTISKSDSFFITANSGNLEFNGNLKVIFCIA